MEGASVSIYASSVTRDGIFSRVAGARAPDASSAGAWGDSDFRAHPMRFEHLTLDEGLSQSNVLSILQDSRGQMWFGTENGLNAFDGYEFRTYYRERGNAIH